MHRFWDDESHWLGLSYGVMVALQFLVLPVLVRIRVRQLEKGIASAILFFVSMRLAVPPSEARIYELNYRRFGNCEKNVCNTKIKLQNAKKGSQFSFDMGKRK